MHSWWEDGLPGALSMRGFVTGVPILAFIGVVLAATKPEVHAVAWLLFVSAGYVFANLLAEILQLATAKSQPAVKRAAALAMVLLAGPITAATAAFLSIASGARVLADTPVHLVASSIVLGVWIFAGGRIDATLQESRRNREETLCEIARGKATALNSAALLEADRQRLFHEVRSMVSEQLDTADATSDSVEMSARLRALVDDSIRPLSHTLHDAKLRDDEYIGERIVTLRTPAPPTIWENPSKMLHAGRCATMFAGFLVATSIALAGVGAREGLGIAWLLFPVAYAIAVAMVLLLSAAQAAETDAELKAALEEADRETALLRQDAWVSRRHLANTMHGEVQARILATALRIQDEPSGDVDAELRSLASDLEETLGSTSNHDDWSLAWERMEGLWSFIIDLEIRWGDGVDERLAQAPSTGAALVAAVGEAVTNAVRHGQSKNVTVSIERVGGDLTVVVDDDGAAAPINTPSLGLGSATFDAVCSRWSLTPHTYRSGHKFEAVIPTQVVSEKTSEVRAS